MDVLDIYANLGATPTSPRDDAVERVVRHEMGHFLGLAHSNNANAVMYAGYDPSRQDGLTDDDLRGICDAYVADQPIGEGCSVASRSNRFRGAEWGLAAMTAWLALRMRRSRGRRLGALAAILAIGLTHSTVARAQAPRPAPRASADAGSTGKKTPKRPAPKPKKPKPTPPTPAEPAELSAEDKALLQQQDGLARSHESAPASPPRAASLAPPAPDAGQAAPD